MKTAFRAAAAALLAFAAQAGCIQAEETSLLYPDGSGKVTIRMSVRKAVLKMIQGAAKNQGQEPERLEDVLSVEKFAALSEGVAAWKAGPREDDAQWIRLTFVGYFEDINRVLIYDTSPFPEEGGKKVLAYAWTYEPRGKGGKLTLAPGAKDLARGLNRLRAPRKDELGQAAKELETIKPMLEDFRVSVSMTVPGTILEFGGFAEKQDRTVSLTLTGETLLGVVADQDGAEARKMRGFGGAFVVWGDASVSHTEVRVFKRELADAKEAWAHRRGPANGKAPPPEAPQKKSLADDADRLSEDEVNRQFVRAQIKTAKIYLKAGSKDEARQILESIVKDYAKYAEAQEAKTLLEGLKK